MGGQAEGQSAPRMMIGRRVAVLEEVLGENSVNNNTYHGSTDGVVYIGRGAQLRYAGSEYGRR